MTRSTRDNTKRRAKQTGALVGVRMQPDQLEAVDAWIDRQHEPVTRPEAIRKMVALQLLRGDS